jgi:hypothetical protein
MLLNVGLLLLNNNNNNIAFVSLILNRFGQDQHEILICQLFQIHQTGSVDEFIEQYTAIVDQLSAYGSTTDPLYYTLRFIDGLKDYIRAPVALHRPQNLDTACVLAKLQEQMADAGKEFRRWEPNAAKPNFNRALPLPPPPPHRQERPASVVAHQPVEPARGPSADERWAALRAQRRAQGLCMRCAGKWSRDHQCPPQVQLNVVQELMELFQLAELPEEEAQDAPVADGQLFSTLSVSAITGTVSPKTMSFSGTLEGVQIRILVDSSSSNTFISTDLASHCSNLQQLDTPLKVQVANGDVISCSSFVPKATWSIQDCHFTSDLKVLPLSTYDMILGLDWLELHSPMKIHWAHKWLKFQYQGSNDFLFPLKFSTGSYRG